MHALWLQFEVEVLEASAHMCFSKLVCVPILCFVQKQQVFLLCFLASHISFFSVTHFQTTWELLNKIPEGICIFATGREIKFTIKISCVVCEGYRNRSVWWSTYQSKKNSATLVQRGALCRNFVSLFCIEPEFGVTVPQQAQFSCRNQEPKQTPPSSCSCVNVSHHWNKYTREYYWLILPEKMSKKPKRWNCERRS